MSLLDAKEITIPDAVVYHLFDDETMLLHLTTGEYYGLDQVGSRIWQLLKQHRTAEPVFAALVKEYEVDESTLRSDLERLLGELANVRLIQVRMEAGA